MVKDHVPKIIRQIFNFSRQNSKFIQNGKFRNRTTGAQTSDQQLKVLPVASSTSNYTMTELKLGAL